MTEADWRIVGWISSTKGVMLSIKDSQGKLIGWLRKDTLEKLLAGGIKGAPVKMPPAKGIPLDADGAGEMDG